MNFVRYIVAAAVLGAVGSPDTSSCRVNTQATDWSVVRTILPTTSPTPITSLAVDVCVYFEQTVGFEQVNPLNLVGCRWGATNLGIIVDVSFDPGFAPGFEVAPSTTVMLPDVAGRVGPYDGVIDFGGSSGQTIGHDTSVLVTASLSVADDSYFRQSWPMYVRTRTLIYEQHSNAGAMVFSSVANAGVGVVVTYQ